MSLPYALCVAPRALLRFGLRRALKLPPPFPCSHLETRFGDDDAARTVAAALAVDPEARAQATRLPHRQLDTGVTTLSLLSSHHRRA